MAVTVIALSIGGCARRPAPPPERVPLDATAGETILHGLGAQSESVQRYQAFFSLSGRGPEGGFSAKLVVLFRRPDALRVELVGPLGGTRWMAVSRPERMEVLFPKSREYVREGRGADVIERLLGMRLDTQEILALLDGSGVARADAHAGGTDAARAFRLGETRRLEFGGGARWVELSSDGQVRRGATSHFKFEYRDDWLEDGRQVPRRIRVETETVRATLSVEDIELNTRLHPEAFQLSIPSDAVRLELAQIGDRAVFVRSLESEPHRQRR